jgi:16S rRNA G966 N2-methylase RsmD
MNKIRYSKKLMGSTIPSGFNYDDEGLWSLTYPNDADKISNIIINEFKYNNIILDGTAGLGGNLISFCKYFKSVIGIENNNNRFLLLKNNISLYNISNVKLYNDNSIKLIFRNNFLNNIDYYFFDPPWGGPNYKNQKKINLKLDNLELNKIIKLIKNPIIFKLPNNYNLIEFSEFNYKIYKISNYIILIFNL